MFNSYASPQTSRFNFWKIGTLALLALFGLAGALYFALSPFITIWNMKRAAEARDGKTFAIYIDFPQFKENLKAELNASIAQKMAKDSKGQGDAFAGIALLLGPTIVNNMVDGFVTPAGIERMMAGEFVPSNQYVPASKSTGPFLGSGNAEMAYTGVSEFQVAVTGADKQVHVFVFERQWLASWKLVNLKLPR